MDFTQIQQIFQSAVSHVPEPLQHALQQPLAQKALATLIALGVLRQVNRSLGSWSVNNWQSALPWKGDRELVLLTGGCSGIGKQIMQDLSKAGVRVVIMDVQEPSFKLPKNVAFYKADITSSENIRSVAEQIRAKHGDPTVLINNAGVGHDGTILEEPEAKIRQTFEVNIISHFLTVKEFLPAMVKNNHGHVVTIASMASFIAVGEMADYCATKAGALAFHEVLSQELKLWYRAKKVRTTVIHPQWVKTPMIQQLSDAGTKFRQPIMTPEDVSNAVVKNILTQSSGQVILPARSAGLSLVRALPTWMQEGVRGIGSKILKDLRDYQASGAL